LQRDAKYELVEPEIPEGVIMDGDMLGMIPHLKYIDHDIIDEIIFGLVPSKFPEETHL
jgi:hypothetical protein